METHRAAPSLDRLESVPGTMFVEPAIQRLARYSQASASALKVVLVTLQGVLYEHLLRLRQK